MCINIFHAIYGTYMYPRSAQALTFVVYRRKRKTWKWLKVTSLQRINFAGSSSLSDLKDYNFPLFSYEKLNILLVIQLTQKIMFIQSRWIHTKLWLR